MSTTCWPPTAPTSGTPTRRCPRRARRCRSSPRAGVRLRLADGRELVDGMSSWWAADPRLPPPRARRRGARPARRHEPRDVRRAHPRARPSSWPELLVDDHPRPACEHVFLATRARSRSRSRSRCACSTSAPGAAPTSTGCMTWRGGYHGDTFGAMSVCDPEGGMHALWRGVLPRQVFAGVPPSSFEHDVRRRARASCVETHADELAARRSSSRSCRARAACASTTRATCTCCASCASPTTCCWCSTRSPPASGAPATLFAAEHAGVAPDVMCVGKALTGGYLTMAAALCTAEVAAGITDGEAGVLMHGPTFMGNPLAAAVALAVDRAAAASGTGAREVRGSRPGLRAGLAPARDAAGGAPTCGCSARSASSSSTTPSTCAAATAAAATARGVAAALPRPRLHHAALRHAGPTTSPRSGRRWSRAGRSAAAG